MKANEENIFDLELEHGDLSECARRLGISRFTVYMVTIGERTKRKAEVQATLSRIVSEREERINNIKML